MDRFFNMENPVWQFFGKMADLLILNLLFLLCCIPIVTIGASLTAMSYVTLKMKDGDEGYIARSFFHSFRENFKQSTLVWLLMLLLAVVLYIDWYMTNSLSGSAIVAMRIVICIGIVIWLMVTLYVFPLIARFQNTTRNMLRNAVLLSFANAPRALLVCGTFLGAAAATFISVQTLSLGLLLWLMFGFSVISLLNSTMQIRLFRKLAGEDENTTDGAQDDEPWDIDQIESDMWPQQPEADEKEVSQEITDREADPDTAKPEEESGQTS